MDTTSCKSVNPAPLEEVEVVATVVLQLYAKGVHLQTMVKSDFPIEPSLLVGDHLPIQLSKTEALDAEVVRVRQPGPGRTGTVVAKVAVPDDFSFPAFLGWDKDRRSANLGNGSTSDNRGKPF